MNFNLHLLRHACRQWGIQPDYYNAEKKVITSLASSLHQVLQDLTQTPVKKDSDLEHLIQQAYNRWPQHGTEYCQVIWGGNFENTTVWIKDKVPSKFKLSFELENSDKLEITVTNFQTREISKDLFRVKISLKQQLPLGYHLLEIEAENFKTWQHLLAPPTALESPNTRTWGPFLPLYALRSENDWGVGSFKELRQAGSFVREFGASWISILPLLAGDFDSTDCDPSPYSAGSRLFWNEFYLNAEELCQKYNRNNLLQQMQDSNIQNEIQRLREQKYVDWHHCWKLKKQFLAPLAKDFFNKSMDQGADYKTFEKNNPELDAYVKFRTANPEEQNLHKFLQFETQVSLQEFNQSSPQLYMDFPVGVNDRGFDFSHFREVFFNAVSVGAPPEPVFRLGQDWGFPALHPYKIRETGYAYLRKSIASHFRFSKLLRIDHVMGLHRVWAVPKGKPGAEGVYLRFKPEELFAVAILEAHRAKADLIGENLGTVPEVVDQLLQKRKINSMWIFEADSCQTQTEIKNKISECQLISVNNHDMAMFESFRQGEDLKLLQTIGILPENLLKIFLENRKIQMQKLSTDLKASEQKEFLHALNELLIKTPARYFVLNMEDFWFETEPQNIPGTWKEYPNWKRKFSRSIEDWNSIPNLKYFLSILKKERG